MQPGTSWRHVWEAALGEAEVVVALRLALDSGHAQVVVAAAAAICALLGAHEHDAGVQPMSELQPCMSQSQLCY